MLQLPRTIAFVKVELLCCLSDADEEIYRYYGCTVNIYFHSHALYCTDLRSVRTAQRKLKSSCLIYLIAAFPSARREAKLVAKFALWCKQIQYLLYSLSVIGHFTVKL